MASPSELLVENTSSGHEARIVGSWFQLRELLSESGGVRTYLGRSIDDDHRVVVKIIPEEAMHPGSLMRLEYEATHLQRLHSSALASIVYVGRESGDLVLVYEHVPGDSLRDCLEGRKLTVREALVVGRALFSALRDMHQHRLLHRGVRPSNIMIDGKDSVALATVVDFDPAPALRGEESALRGQSLSAAMYLSPEQSGSIDQDVTEASDLYSAGVTLFHCLAGRPPFNGNTLGAILFEHMTASVPKLRSVVSTIPRALEEVVQRLLRKDPRDRYQSAEAVLADLLEIEAALERGESEPAIVIGASDARQTLTEPAFVARADEMAALDQQLEMAQRGQAGLILLEGESGGGKTRLLTEFTYRAAARGFWNLWGQGTNDVARQPFSLLLGVVEAFLIAAEADPALADRVRERLGDQAPAVGAALPGLARFFSAAGAYGSAPEEAGEVRTLHALTSFLNALGTPERPVLLVLDDCQWADELTYRLIRRWQTHADTEAGQRHVLMLSACRSEEIDADHLLRKVSPNLHLRLSPFSPDEISQLAVSMAGPLPTEVIQAIVRLADGSPFMGSAVLRGMVEFEMLVREPDGWRIESENISDIQSSSQAGTFLARRLTLLPADTLELLSHGAVLGKEFELNIATQLTGQSPAQAITALDVARQRRLVWLRPDGSRCVFVHDKIRSALLDGQAEIDRCALHTRAAKYLEDHTPNRAAEIAYHFDSAGDVGSALPYALKAAEEARAQYALEVAEQQYKIAQRGAAGAGAAMKYRVAQELGEVLLLRGRYDAAEEKFAAAAEIAEGTVAQAQIRGKMGEVAFKRGDMERAINYFESALRTVGGSVPRKYAIVVMLVVWEAFIQFLHTWLPRCLVHRYKRLPDERERLTLRLLSNHTHGYWYCRTPMHTLWAHLRNLNLAERYLPTLELGLAYCEHAPVITLVGLHRRARAYAEKSLKIRQDLNDLSGQAQSLHYHGIVLYAGSEYQQSIKKCRDAIRVLERTGDYWQVHIARYQIAASLYRLGDLPGAVEEAQLNYKSGIELGDEQASGIILEVWARATGGAIPEKILKEELERPRHDAQGRTQVLFADGLRLLGSGSLPEARAQIEQAIKVADDAGVCNAYTLPCVPWLATTLRQQAARQTDMAWLRRKRLLRRASKAARRAARASWLCKNDLPHAYRELGIIAAMRGKPRRAKKHFDKSIAIAKRQQARYEYAQTLLAKAELEAELDQPEALINKAEAQAILGELHAYETHENAQRETAEPATLSLADRFDAVLDWGRRIASALSAPVILGEARVAALRLLRAEHCMVLQIVQTSGEPEFIAASGRIPGSCNKAKLKESLQVRRAIAFLEHAAQQGSDSADAGRERSALCAPIYVRGVAVACLYVTHEQVRGLFGGDEERLADYIATIAGAALENAEGFGQLQALNETLEMRVADRTAAVEARSRELALSNEELERTTGELLQAQQQLTVAKQAAEAASEAKSRFLAMMSHEIRTPLNGVIGMTELTLNSALTSPQRNHLTVVRDSAQSLLAILNDVLDFSKIEAGRLDLESIPLSVRDTVEDATRLLAVPAARKGLELTCHVAQNVPDQLLGDPIRLRQIILNLVGNAIKFTEHGEVFVSVDCRERVGNRLVLHFAVQDSGIGIAPDKQQSIFEAFRQNDNSMTRRFGGTGLGLSISSQIVGLMGGRIWVESQLGSGSTFQFVVPMELALAVPAAESAPLVGRQGQNPPSVVCISANHRARDAHASMLLTWGFEVATADAYESIDELMAKCRPDSRNGLLIDLLLIDISAANPVIEIEVLEALQERLHAAVPIVALVAPAASADVAEHCIELGCEQCLTKPVKMKELEEAVKIALNCDGAQTTASAASDAMHAARSLHILIADDSPVNLEVAAGLLDLRGHRVRTANSGREALALWQNEQFDVVLMDLEMHDMDGLATTAAMRAREQSGVLRQPARSHRASNDADLTPEAKPSKTRTPIVAMTAHAGHGFQQRCQAAGMDAYISKPFQPDELFRIVEGFDARESVADQSANNSRQNVVGPSVSA